MSRSNKLRFHMRGRAYQAEAILAVVPVNETDVQIRYGDGAEDVVITNTTTSAILAAIDRAHLKHR